MTKRDRNTIKTKHYQIIILNKHTTRFTKCVALYVLDSALLTHLNVNINLRVQTELALR